MSNMLWEHCGAGTGTIFVQIAEYSKEEEYPS